MTTAIDYSASSVAAADWSQFDWRENLHVPARRLVELQALTENGFLQIGKSLHDFHRRAGEVSTSGARIVDELLGDAAEERVSRLQLLVERMSIFLNGIEQMSRQNEESLRAICLELKQLSGPLQSFQKITKTLHVVGITTRIESSENRDDQAGGRGSVLSDDLCRLAELIAGNMVSIVDQVELLRGLSETALKNETTLFTGQSQKALAAVDHAREAFVELAGNQRQVAHKSETLAHSSEDIASSIGEIVSSMQFHDITCQQIEHARLTLDAMSDVVVDHFSTDEAKDKIQRQKIELAVAEGCRLQSEQLGHSRHELSSAIWRIIESLQVLAGSVTDLARSTCDLAGVTEQRNVSYLSALEPAIGAVTDVLVENSETAAKSLQAVFNVVCAVEEMSGQVNEVRRFGAEMKVLSLNASVEAVHAKSGGSALSIIADTIQELADEALEQTETLANGLDRISGFAESLGGGNIGEALNGTKEVEKLTDDSTRLLTDLRVCQENLIQELGSMEQGSGQLAADISGCVESIGMQQDVETIINASISDLTQIAERFPQSVDSWKEVQHIPLFKEMQDRYSMQSERDVHLRVLRQQGVALQEKAVSDRPESMVVRSENDLGSNVELF